MKKVSMETKYSELKEAAKELGIKFNGVKAATLVETINAKIDELAGPKVKKTLEEVGFVKDELIQIDGSKLTGRAANLNGRLARVQEITGRGFLRVQLVNKQNGELQGSMVRMPVAAITKGEVTEQTEAAV